MSKSIVIAVHLYVLFSWVKRITNWDSRTTGGIFMEIYWRSIKTYIYTSQYVVITIPKPTFSFKMQCIILPWLGYLGNFGNELFFSLNQMISHQRNTSDWLNNLQEVWLNKVCYGDTNWRCIFTRDHKNSIAT